MIALVIVIIASSIASAVVRTGPGSATSATSTASPSSSSGSPVTSSGSATRSTGSPSVPAFDGISAARPFAGPPWGDLRTSARPLTGVTVLSYEQAAALATSAAAGYQGHDWTVVVGIGARDPNSAEAIVTNTSFGICPIQVIGPIPSPFTISGTPSTAPLGTSAFTEFFLESSSAPGEELFVVVDNGTAYLFYSTPTAIYDGNTCGLGYGPSWVIPPQVIDSPAAVTIADSVSGSAFLAANPGATESWEFLPSELAPTLDDVVHPSLPLWIVSYQTAGSCAFFNSGGTGIELEVSMDAATGAAVKSSQYQCETEYPVVFTETGLPAGTLWTVQTYYEGANSSVSATLAFAAANGTESYGVAPEPGYAASPASGTFDVIGAPVNVSITFTPATTYRVSFNETGLLPEVGWLVTLDGVTETSFGSTISFVEPAGSYNYTVVGPQNVYTVSPSTGKVSVSSAPVGVAVTFVAVPPYSVAFSETGLPTGTSWGGYLYTTDFTSWFFTTAGSQTLSLVNGTYEYYLGSTSPYYNTTSYAEFTVSGGPVNITVNFTGRSAYVLTFTEEGLPAGTPWMVGLEGYYLANSTNTTTIGFVEPNATYHFFVGPVSGYVASPATGDAILDGAPADQVIIFSQNASTPLYAVTFSETGLPTGTPWGVTVGATTSTTSGTSVEFNLTNGSYAFTVLAVPGYVIVTISTHSSSSSMVQVDGAPVQVEITFAPVSTTKYTVTFDETGLSPGTNWTVILNGTRMSSTTASIAFSELNGSYAYSVASIDGYVPSPSSGTIVVSGGPVSTSIVFSTAPAARYAVTFSETGLTPGVTWSVGFASMENSSASAAIGFEVVNGTYSFSLGSVAGYTARPGTGSLTVSGMPISQSIVFTPLPRGEYSVVFTESGLPSGTRWTVTLNGTANSSAITTIGFVIRNGSYAFTVAAVSGYTVAPSAGDANVTGKSVSIAVTFSPTSSSSPSSPTFLGLPALEGYALLGAIILVILAVILAVAMRGRRKPGVPSPGASPPPSAGTPPPGGP